jgi:hypothetical protein
VCGSLLSAEAKRRREDLKRRSPGSRRPPRPFTGSEATKSSGVTANTPGEHSGWGRHMSGDPWYLPTNFSLFFCSACHWSNCRLQNPKERKKVTANSQHRTYGGVMATRTNSGNPWSPRWSELAAKGLVTDAERRVQGLCNPPIRPVWERFPAVGRFGKGCMFLCLAKYGLN